MSEKSLKVKASATLSLEFKDLEEAMIALRAIQPDNYPLPSGLSIHMEAEGCKVYVYIESSRTIRSVLATLDDVLAMMNLSIRSASILDRKF
ncbi:MAG: KEOPS complex subunit Pcc1 [Candidatus Caldarchaeales archaeon]